MARLTSVKHLFIATLGIAGAFVACRATSPEAPPLAPSPDPSAPAPSPVPSGPTIPDEPGSPGPNFPTEDGGAPASPAPGPVSITAPEFRGERYQLIDAGLRDAPLAADAIPADAGRPIMPNDARPPADAVLSPVPK